MAYELMPAEQKEGWLFYRLDSEGEERHGAIGYLRADYGRSGKEFWTTWFDIQTGLKTVDFKNELQEVIDSLRNDGAKPPFASRANLQSYCAENPAYPLTNHAVGFAVRTLNHTYAFRCAPGRGDYDVTCFTFDNRFLLPELAGKHELPFGCVSTLPSTGEVIYIMQGKAGYLVWPKSSADPAVNRQMVDEQNQKMGVSRQQEAAMLAGATQGWDTSGAKPWNYDQNGSPRESSPQKPKNREDR